MTSVEDCLFQLSCSNPREAAARRAVWEGNLTAMAAQLSILKSGTMGGCIPDIPHRGLLKGTSSSGGMEK